MGLFSRKQGRLATVRTMARFTESEREHGMDMLQAAEDVFVDVGAPSRLGSVIFTACVGAMGVDEDDPVFGVLAGASLLGYACRMASPAVRIPDDIADAIELQLEIGDDGELDYDAMADTPDALRNLVEYAATFADDPKAIAALAGATEGAWQAFATAATFQLHKNLVANGLPKRALPSSETVENLLRLGYAIRLVDETAGADPMYKDGSTPGAADEDLPEANGLSINRDDGPPPAEPIDIQQWLNDASGVCTHDFEPYAEHVLELITLDRLGVLPLMDALMGERPADGAVGDDVVVAVSNARLGYALRNREMQLLGRPDHVATDDAIATLLEERWGHGATVDTLVIAGVLRDIITFGFLGGSENLYAATPGTTPEVRRRAIKRWADRHFPGDSKVTGRNITIELLEYGYALHRLFEIHPDALSEPE